MIARRSFLLGLGAAVCAPAIIRPGVLMPVKKALMPGDGIALFSMEHPPALGPVMCTSFVQRFSIVEVSLDSIAPELLRPGLRIIGVAAETKGGIFKGDLVTSREPTPYPPRV